MDDGQLMDVLREMQAESERVARTRRRADDEATDYVRAKIATIRRNVRQFQAQQSGRRGDAATPAERRSGRAAAALRPADSARDGRSGDAAAARQPAGFRAPRSTAASGRAPCSISPTDWPTAIRARRSVVCVGLDPTLDAHASGAASSGTGRGAAELGDDGAVAACFQEFCCGIVEAVADVGRLRQAAGGLLRAVRRGRLERARAPSSAAPTSTSCR